MYYPHVLSRLRMSAWISHVLGLGWDDWPWIVKGPTATMDSGTDSSGSQKGSALDEERRCRKPGWCHLENWWIEWCYGCIMWLSMGAPQNRWFIIENLMKMDDLGVPLFYEPPCLRMGKTPPFLPGKPCGCSNSLKGWQQPFGWAST